MRTGDIAIGVLGRDPVRSAAAPLSVPNAGLDHLSRRRHECGLVDWFVPRIVAPDYAFAGYVRAFHNHGSRSRVTQL